MTVYIREKRGKNWTRYINMTAKRKRVRRWKTDRQNRRLMDINKGREGERKDADDDMTELVQQRLELPCRSWPACVTLRKSGLIQKTNHTLMHTTPHRRCHLTCADRKTSHASWRRQGGGGQRIKPTWRFDRYEARWLLWLVALTCCASPVLADIRGSGCDRNNCDAVKTKRGALSRGRGAS